MKTNKIIETMDNINDQILIVKNTIQFVNGHLENNNVFVLNDCLDKAAIDLQNAFDCLSKAVKELDKIEKNKN